MHSVTIRHVTADVLHHLRALAKRNHRSLQGELLHHLEQLASTARPDEYRPTSHLVRIHKRP